MVAIQLGLVKDAEKLYKGCERYDLLNLQHQACGMHAQLVCDVGQRARESKSEDGPSMLR